MESNERTTLSIVLSIVEEMVENSCRGGLNVSNDLVNSSLTDTSSLTDISSLTDASPLPGLSSNTDFSSLSRTSSSSAMDDHTSGPLRHASLAAIGTSTPLHETPAADVPAKPKSPQLSPVIGSSDGLGNGWLPPRRLFSPDNPVEYGGDML